MRRMISCFFTLCRLHSGLVNIQLEYEDYEIVGGGSQQVICNLDCDLVQVTLDYDYLNAC